MVVDRFALASDGTTVAVGDVANMPNPRPRLRAGRTDPAGERQQRHRACQGGRVLAHGRREEYAGIPWFWSEPGRPQAADRRASATATTRPCSGATRSAESSASSTTGRAGSSPPTASTPRWTSWPSRTPWPRARTSRRTPRRTRHATQDHHHGQLTASDSQLAHPKEHHEHPHQTPVAAPAPVTAGPPDEPADDRRPRPSPPTHPVRPVPGHRAGGHHPHRTHARRPWGAGRALEGRGARDPHPRQRHPPARFRWPSPSGLCRAYPDADARTGAGGHAAARHRLGARGRVTHHLRGFAGDWRKAAIRYEHELQGCNVARRVLPAAGLLAPTSSSGSARSSTATTPARWRTPWRTR